MGYQGCNALAALHAHLYVGCLTFLMYVMSRSLTVYHIKPLLYVHEYGQHHESFLLPAIQASSAPRLETVNVLYRAGVSAALPLQPLSAEPHELPTNNESEVPARNVVV
jgi:hypothetical protein